MEESDFTADVFTRFSEIMMNDSELGPFFVNTGLTVGYPSCLEFHTHLNHIKDVMYNFMNEYYGNGTKHRDLYDLTNSPVVINISNHSVTTTTGYSQTTTGVKYIKAALTSNQTGTSKTNQWVEGLEGFGSSGDFYKTNSGPSTNGPHAIPNGWRTHTFTP